MEKLAQIELGENCFKCIHDVVLESRIACSVCMTVDLSSLSSISLNSNALLGDETNLVSDPKRARFSNLLRLKSLHTVTTCEI